MYRDCSTPEDLVCKSSEQSDPQGRSTGWESLRGAKVGPMAIVACFASASAHSPRAVVPWRSKSRFSRRTRGPHIRSGSRLCFHHSCFLTTSLPCYIIQPRPHLHYASGCPTAGTHSLPSCSDRSTTLLRTSPAVRQAMIFRNMLSVKIPRR